jgi:hypothetical protein
VFLSLFLSLPVKADSKKNNLESRATVNKRNELFGGVSRFLHAKILYYEIKRRFLIHGNIN